jgi:hypothetical protein
MLQVHALGEEEGVGEEVEEEEGVGDDVEEEGVGEDVEGGDVAPLQGPP